MASQEITIDDLNSLIRYHEVAYGFYGEERFRIVLARFEDEFGEGDILQGINRLGQPWEIEAVEVGTERYEASQIVE